MENNTKILFYGYGNPGRQDDALGICFIEELQAWVTEQKIKNIYFDSNYQLNIEDAELISRFDIVFFVDASLEEIEQFSISKLEPSSAQIEFTMHAISPGVVLNLCHQICNFTPKSFLIHIKGYEWDLKFDQGLTENARNNLHSSLEYIKRFLKQFENSASVDINFDIYR